MKTIVGILFTALVAVGLVGCASEPKQDEYAAVCVDPNTEQRLEDDACEQGDSDYLTHAVLWYLLLSNNAHVPGVGHHVTKSHFKTSKPKNARIKHVSESGYTYKAPKKTSNNGGSKKKSGWGGSKSKSGGSKRR